jgi:carbonic anhydrase
MGPSPEDPHWSYEGKTGPSNWGALTEKWELCKNGTGQSPINIDKTRKADLPELVADFEPAQLKILHSTHVADAINNGHTIQVSYAGADSLSIGDKEFQLVQYHFHGPSEHTVRGKHFPMEMHLVHKSKGGKLAVLAVLIEEGKHNAAFDPIWDNLPKTKDSENHFEKVNVDVDQLLPSVKTTYRYDGSLTTPPCSEGVKWIILTAPIQLSNQQISAFQNIIHHNNRPVQRLNGREVVTDSLIEK